MSAEHELLLKIFPLLLLIETFVQLDERMGKTNGERKWINRAENYGESICR